MFSKAKKKLLKLCSPAFKKMAQQKHIAHILTKLGFHDRDLPFHKSDDTRFLILLIGLMSFLTVLACSGSFALARMTNHWSSGLENKVTIEIPVETNNGNLLSNDTVKKETKKIADGLKHNPNIRKVSILSNQDVQDLISPWIGQGLTLNDIPLPGLIALELNHSNKKAIETLEKDIQALSNYANLETHHEWLADLIRFTTTLKGLAAFVALIIGGTMITAITAGIRTRLALHHREVELLHFMGATDHYIARQFQRHALLIAFKGGVYGTIAGLIITAIIAAFSMQSELAFIPSIKIGLGAILFLCCIPIFASVLAALTSRFTVLRSLAKMP